jgi:tetratricopeptide (TPR) repeat protein
MGVFLQVLLAEAEECKGRGNDLFKQERHVEAIEEYEKALDIAPPEASQRAVYNANMAACYLALEDYKACVECCSAALRVNPDYLKALRRKMTAHEKLDELENALADAKRVRQRTHLT